MKKLILILLVMAMALPLYAFTVTDNPSGGLYPAHLRRDVKGKSIPFVLSTVGDSVAIHTALDTTSGAWKFLWVAPFNCKVDSLKIVLGTALLALDTVYTRYWAIRGISNNSATNGDTIWRDSTMRFPLTATTITQYTVWTPKGGPDSTLNKMTKGKILRITLDQLGAAATPMKWFGEFFVTPSDW
jgi:hypothetical protein